MSKTLNTLAKEFIKFSTTTFIGATSEISIKKLEAEIVELKEELAMPICFHGIELLNEYVDCHMCLLDSMAREGFTVEQFTAAFEKKLTANKKRKWVMNENGTYSHVKQK